MSEMMKNIEQIYLKKNEKKIEIDFFAINLLICKKNSLLE